MIRSMTGYGGAQHVANGVTYAVELKSVNHRYLKVGLRLPDSLQYAEGSVEKLLRGRIARGSLSYALRVRADDNGASTRLNLAVAQRYADQLTQLKLPPGVEATIDLAALAALPGVSEPPAADGVAQEQTLQAIETVTAEALDALVTMRDTEGQALHRDLAALCADMRARVADVSARAPLVVTEYHERLRSRVERLLAAGELELEKDALAREVAVYADRCDISEEIARLGAHLDQFEAVCGREGQVGRTLDFLTQEMLREANTIASKSSDIDISRHVVEIKRGVDRLREQVQNVE